MTGRALRKFGQMPCNRRVGTWIATIRLGVLLIDGKGVCHDAAA